MSFRKYLILAGVALFSALGDVSLSYGMKRVGAIPLERWTVAFTALASPWVILGILLLLAFFVAYLTALSWADLTYVLPATAMGYVVVALLSVWLLNETVTPMRWLGIGLVSGGVGFVARGPEITVRHAGQDETAEIAATRSRS
ncbi:MAG: DMT family transporter [Acidobacteria bacterium]|nr:DMT family transporter [Acidobacteriota bacterium]